MPDCGHIHVTFDGDTHWLACFATNPDGCHGDPIHPIEAGDDWATLAGKVEAHQCGSDAA